MLLSGGGVARDHRGVIANLNTGNHVAVWHGEGGAITGQLLNTAGAAVGSVFTVNTPASDVTALPDGGFAVSWQRFSYSSFQADVCAQTHRPDCMAAFLVNSTVAGDQTYARIAVGTDGRLFAIWTAQNGAVVDMVACHRLLRLRQTRRASAIAGS